MCLDEGNDQVVLWGGFGGGMASSLLETWLWDGTTWAQQSPAASPAGIYGGYAAPLAYDANNGNVVLFTNTGPLGLTSTAQTWLWNGINWALQTPAHSPPPCWGACMAYDAANSNVVLYGGFTTSTLLSKYDTWVWDGSDWTMVATGAPRSSTASNGCGIAFDEMNGNIVQFGGAIGGSSFFDDTWIWDGAAWTLQSPTSSPDARSCLGMTYSEDCSEVIIFGGIGPVGPYHADTWSWNGSDWAQLSPISFPSARGVSNEFGTQGLCKNVSAGGGDIVWFGGQAASGMSAVYYDETWEFTCGSNPPATNHPYLNANFSTV
jgi:hypothetical protein